MARRAAVLGGQSRMEQILLEQRSPVRTASLSSFGPASPAFAETRPVDSVPANGAPNVFGSDRGSPFLDPARRAVAAPQRAPDRQLAGFTGAFRPATAQ